MAYINAKEVKAIREELKREFPKHRFSVTKDSGGLAVSVSVMKGPDDLLSDIGETWAGSGYTQINHYHTGQYGKHQKFFDKVVQVIKSAPAKAEGGRAWYDNSDAMIDYFDTAFYIHMNVGKYGKGYQVV